jgi:uncharacterized membrane protein YgcG
MTDPRRPSDFRPANSSSTLYGQIPQPVDPGPRGYPGQPPPGAPPGWTPAWGPGDQPPPPSSSAGPPPGRSPRRRKAIIVTLAAGVVVATATTLAFALGGNDTVLRGQPTAASDPRTVAQIFVNLETERYNAGTESSTPAPSAAAYAGVSCQQDLTEMRGNGASPPPLASPHKLFSFSIVSISPAAKGTQSLRIARTTLSTKDTGDGLFTLQREAGKWRVCGLFPDSDPSAPTSGSGGSGGNGASAGNSNDGSGNNSGGGNTEPPSTAPTGVAGAMQTFLVGFSNAVAAGQAGTAAQAVCVDDPSAIPPIESWVSAHAQVNATIKTVGTKGGSASLQVSIPAKAPATYTAVIAQDDGALCIDILTQ